MLKHKLDLNIDQIHHFIKYIRPQSSIIQKEFINFTKTLWEFRQTLARKEEKL